MIATTADLDLAYLCRDCLACRTSLECRRCRQPLCYACAGVDRLCDRCCCAAESASDRGRDR